MNILVVCLGNICRSPMAHGLLLDKVNKEKLNWTIDSAGTGGWHAGETPDKRMQVTAKKHGIDLSQLKARQFVVADFNDFDLIYAMDSSNYENIVALAKTEQEKDKVKMILEESHPNMNLSVPDPYYGGEDGFEDVYNLLNDAVTTLVERLLK